MSFKVAFYIPNKVLLDKHLIMNKSAPSYVFKTDTIHGVIVSVIVIVLGAVIFHFFPHPNAQNQDVALSQDRVSHYQAIVSELDSIEHSPMTTIELQRDLDLLSTGLTKGRITSKELGKSSVLNEKGEGWVTVYRRELARRIEKEKK